MVDHTRAIKINPDDAIAYQNRGLTYKSLGNYQDAIAAFSSAIRIDPDLAYAYVGRSMVYESQKNYEECLSDYTRAIRIEPDDSFLYLLRATVKRFNLNIPFCSDYKKACDLGNENCCEWYYKQCR